MNPRLPYNAIQYRIPMPNNRARPNIPYQGPSRARFQVPFDLHYGPFSSQFATQFFYFSANIAAKVDKLYIPVEISIVEFSFEHGITRSYHKILEQNNIPKGLSYDVSLQMGKHRIDVAEHTELSGQPEAIFGEIVQFIGNTTTANSIIMFCEDLKLEQNLSIVKWLQEKHCESSTIAVRMYGIQQLMEHFVDQSTVSSSKSQSLSKSTMSRLMQKSFFDSYLKQVCGHHKVLQSDLCTLDDSYKAAYAFLFAMCVLVGLPLESLPIPGLANMKSFLQKMVQRIVK